MINQYIIGFRNLAAKVATLTDDGKLICFVNGLRPETRLEVQCKSPATLQQAIDFATAYEQIRFGDSSNRQWSSNQRRPFEARQEQRRPFEARQQSHVTNRSNTTFQRPNTTSQQPFVPRQQAYTPRLQSNSSQQRPSFNSQKPTPLRTWMSNNQQRPTSTQRWTPPAQSRPKENFQRANYATQTKSKDERTTSHRESKN